MSNNTGNVLTPEFMAEVRLSLNTDYPSEKLAELFSSDRIALYRDALAKMVADVDDQLAARGARAEELAETDKARFADYDAEYAVWRRKALDFKKYVSARLREVNATVKEQNRSRNDVFRRLKAERNEALLALSELLDDYEAHLTLNERDDNLAARCRALLTSYETDGAEVGS